MAKINVYFIILILSFSISSCIAKPVYTPPEDPYEINNPIFLSLQPKVLEAIQKAGDINRWYEVKKDKQKELESIYMQLNTLVVQNHHIPSFDLITSLKDAYCKGFFQSGGITGKFKKYYQNLIKTRKIKADEIIKKYTNYCLEASTNTINIARYGYPPAVERLKKANVEIPEKSLKTSSEIKSELDYQESLYKYKTENRMIINAILNGIASTGSAYLASKDSSQSPQTYSYTPSSNYGSTYDPSSGNSYKWSKDSLGNTKVDGFNYSTGSSWSETIEVNGDMKGYDSSGNYWTYDKSIGNYYNYGTGKQCFGKANFRECF